MAVVLLIAAVILCIIFASISYYQQIRLCEDNGGEWKKYNCQSYIKTHCTQRRDYSGNLVSDCFEEPEERCDYHCVGANAEGSNR